MRIRERAVRDECAGAEKVVCSRNVVAGLVPVVGQAQQREMGEIECDKDQREDQPEGEALVSRLSGGSEKGDDFCLCRVN
jgi:hypothetical protein